MTDRTPRILIAANVIGMAAVAVFIILWQVNLIYLGPVDSLTKPLRLLISISAAGVVVVNTLFLTYRFYSNRESHLKAKTEDGFVSIAVGAIEESLARTAKSLPEVHDARVRVYKEKAETSPVTIVINYAVWEETNVREVTRKVQQACMMRFEQIAGREIQPTFSIYVSRIDVKEIRKASRKGSREEEPVDLFRGPQYPTGGEY
jgi:hypothetical protein